MAKVLSQKEEDIKMLLAADAHLGTKNVKFQMDRYVFKRRPHGIYIIGKAWEKLMWAAKCIVPIENQQDIIIRSARPYAQRGVLKVADFINAEPLAGKHTPGPFTNRIQKNERRFPVKSSDLRRRSSSSRLS